ncbi:MAG: quinone-dependent dihydroorotate dehydrogenase [Polyangiaceae bacterium]
MPRAALYPLLFHGVLRHLSAETAHELAMTALVVGDHLPGVAAGLSRLLSARDPSLAVDAFGVRFPSPIGLAAGFDKDARAARMLLALGFGFLEIGTVTAQAQPGNPKPRLFRLVKDHAIVNRMGFNNRGARAAAERLGRHLARPSVAGGVVAANIGKTKVVSEADAAADYAESARELAPHAAFLVVNVSSPNTPGLRDLQRAAALEPILVAVRAALDESRRGSSDGAPRRVPLLVKIAPDLADEDVDAVADLAVKLGLDGIVAANTTISRAGLSSSEAEVAACGAGGLSGPPLAARSSALVERLYRRVGDRLVIIAAGGITTDADAWDRIVHGATLCELYTAFIYEGPLVAFRIHRGLARRAREAGFSSIRDAVGSAVTFTGRSVAPRARGPVS